MKTLLLAMALAQTSPHVRSKAPAPKYQPVTTIVVDGDEIDGDRAGPGGIVIQEPPQVRHSSLIQIRDNFRHQVLQSVGDLK